MAKAIFFFLLIIFAAPSPVKPGLAATPPPPEAGSPGESLDTTFELEGQLVPIEYVSLASSNDARAGLVFIQEGQPVTVGMVLVQLDTYPQRAAAVAAAELQVVLARQELDELNQNAAVDLAQAEVALALARKEQAFASDRYASLSRPIPQADLDQAYANLLLAENRLARTQDDLAKAQKHYANKDHIIWHFINARQFKLQLTLLERQVADDEGRMWDAREKYDDLKAGTDPVDLEIAAANLEIANARVDESARRRDDLLGSPDPDALETARARLETAEADLAAAQAALGQAQIVSPISGLAVAVDVKPGEWMLAGEPRITVADLSRWEVETSEIEEDDVARLELGGVVRLAFPALPLPGLELEGRIESVDLFYREEDGDIYYGMTVIPMSSDPRFRWGMTAIIEID